ncbi:hypothetical protein [Solicola sp. PLA-1-18]|uniref:hypothetical protein n=1 Tax=Solicola sp. PLA-1-18 TaxID=3380532 RepID=UPI003B9EAB10
MDDDELLREVADLWRRRDPVPDGLAERVLVEIALDDLDAEHELLVLVEDQQTAVRGDGPRSTYAFDGTETHLLLRIADVDGGRRVDGWVAPAMPMTARLRQAGTTYEAVVDERGRFELPRVTPGPSRLWLTPTGGDGPLLATPSFAI